MLFDTTAEAINLGKHRGHPTLHREQNLVSKKEKRALKQVRFLFVKMFQYGNCVDSA